MEIVHSSRRDPISVLIAAADPMVGGLLSGLLKRHPGFEVSASVVNRNCLLQTMRRVTADVALVSVDLEDGPLSGLAVLRDMRELNSHLPIVVLLNESKAQMVVEALRMGARGVFSRTHFEPATLFKCVRRVHEGQIWLKTEELEYALTALSQTPQLRIVDSGGAKLLTNREEAVMRLVAEGLSNRDIAQQLRLSEHTVKNYLFHIFDKLGISNRVELVLYATTNSSNSQPVFEQEGETAALDKVN